MSKQQQEAFLRLSRYKSAYNPLRYITVWLHVLCMHNLWI